MPLVLVKFPTKCWKIEFPLEESSRKIYMDTYDNPVNYKNSESQNVACDEEYKTSKNTVERIWVNMLITLKVKLL